MQLPMETVEYILRKLCVPSVSGPLPVIAKSRRRRIRQPYGPKKDLRAALLVAMSCKTFQLQTRELWRSVCQDIGIYRHGVPVPRLLQLHLDTRCSECHVTNPSPVRWGFERRMCAWCFQNTTIPARVADKLCETKHLPAEFRLITSVSGIGKESVKVVTVQHVMNQIMNACIE